MKNGSMFRILLVVLTVMAFLVSAGVSQPNNDGHKVEICHVPPGDPGNAHTIEVDEEAELAPHLAHGDYLGECRPPPPVPELSTSILVSSGIIGLIGFTRLKKN